MQRSYSVTPLYLGNSRWAAISLDMFNQSSLCNMAIVTDGWRRSEPRPVPEPTSSESVQRRRCRQKSAGLVDLMFDNKLDVIAVNETWIGESAPDSVKYGLAPTSYNISHVHRPWSLVDQHATAAWQSLQQMELSFATTNCRPPGALRRSSCN